MRTLASFIVLLSICGTGSGTERTHVPPPLTDNSPTSSPVGYIDFCKHFPDECVARGAEGLVVLTEQTWKDLEEVNAIVNYFISFEMDLTLYGRDELWMLPETAGDCEDFVLLKRKYLIGRGWPTGALLVTVVLDEFDSGHAVLLARTTSGDFVLDNKNNSLRRWYETVYRFQKRQSFGDPNQWVDFNDTRSRTQDTGSH
ncbi:transglutaminase-like cysteine peptidase [Acetobacteraceae bacterium]|nr:transglutaminase-like cysteine peptidase [Candidatus Parcubacteria bacterium]